MLKVYKNKNIKENTKEMGKIIFILVVIDSGFENFENIYKKEIIC